MDEHPPLSSDMPRTHQFSWSKAFGLLVVILILGAAAYALFNMLGRGSIIGGAYDDFESGYEYPACNIAGINVHGTIYTYVPPESYGGPEGELTEDVVGSEDIVAAIWDAEKDEGVKGIMLDIDSSGGSPVAAEEIANALNMVKKPTVAVIRQIGTSAAYWAATGADMILASKSSDIGSIGVTMSYLRDIDPTKQYIELTSGKFKDAGSPDKAITPEEKALLLRDVEITHKNFIEAVAANRRLSVEKVTALADGSSVLGEKAKELGLIDGIGGWKEAEDYLDSRIDDEIVVCW